MKEITRLIKALGYSLEGMKYIMKTQKNARLLFILMALVLILGVFVRDINKAEFAILFFSIALVTATETINTAIEHTLDIISEGKFHPGVKIAKDVASAAVLITIVNVVVIIFIIFFTNTFRAMIF